jgi:putative spermidine/putrescine transport system substrate-binding protein
MKLLDIVGRPEAQAAFARLLYYGPSNQNAFKFLDAKIAAHLPSKPEHAKVGMLLDYEYWLKNMDAVSKRYDAWLRA